MTMNQEVNAAMDASDATTKPAKGGANRRFLIGGLVATVVIAGVILVTNKSDAPRSGTASCATTSQGCEIGDIGPGGGKVYSLGGATSPADCTQYNCLEVAPARWARGVDPKGDWRTAGSRAAAYATSTAAAGTWRLPSQAELIALAGGPSSVSGLVSQQIYWSSTRSSSQPLIPGFLTSLIAAPLSCRYCASRRIPASPYAPFTRFNPPLSTSS